MPVLIIVRNWFFQLQSSFKTNCSFKLICFTLVQLEILNPEWHIDFISDNVIKVLTKFISKSHFCGWIKYDEQKFVLYSWWMLLFLQNRAEFCWVRERIKWNKSRCMPVEWRSWESCYVSFRYLIGSIMRNEPLDGEAVGIRCSPAGNKERGAPLVFARCTAIMKQ